MRKVRCRVSCSKVHDVKGRLGLKVSEEVECSTDYPSASEGDQSAKEDISLFYDASPGVEFKIMINNPGAHEFFKHGHSYYFDITEVPLELQPQSLQDELAKAE